ncbi:unnamed protein product [Brassica oleracea]
MLDSGYQGWEYRSDGSILPNIALWNPLLNKLRWVEQAAGCITSSDYYGIGYNNGDGNYKLVRFTCRPFEVEGFENVPEVEIYEFTKVNVEDGTRIIKIYKEYMSKTCILDDFKFYETRQKMIRDKKIKQMK